MAVDKDYIAAIAPTFAVVPDAQSAALISIASVQVAPAVWGDLTDYAIALLVLHTWTIGKNGGGGAVTSEQMGDLRISYAVPGKELDQTGYGAEYRRLGRTRLTGPLVT